MATADRVLQLKLISDVGTLGKDAKKAEGRFKSMARSAASWGKAMTGALVIEGVVRLGDALGDAWEGFREGERVASQLGTTMRNLGMDGDDLTATLDAITASTLALGTSDDEAVSAVNTLIKMTGDQSKALRYLSIAQDLVANGSAPDLASAIRIIQGAAKGTSKVVDRFGLSAKTAGGRVRELKDSVKGSAEAAAKLDPWGVAFNKISEGLESVVGAAGPVVAQLGTLASENIGPAMDAVAKGWDAIATAFGSLPPGADAIVLALAAAFGVLAVALWANPAVLAVGGIIAGVAALGALLGFLESFGDAGPVIAAGLGVLTVAVVALSAALWANPIVLIGAGIVAAGIGIALAVTWIIDNIEGLLAFLERIGEELGKAAQRAGDAIANGIKWGIDLAVTAVKNAINSMIDLWNQLDFSIPSGSFEFWGASRQLAGTPLEFKIDRFALEWPGTGDLFPDVPRLASGGIVNKPTMALIGEGGREAVVPLDRGGFGNTEVNITVQGALVDPVGAGKAVVAAIRAYEASSGALWRKGSGATRTRYG